MAVGGGVEEIAAGLGLIPVKFSGGDDDVLGSGSRANSRFDGGRYSNKYSLTLIVGEGCLI